MLHAEVIVNVSMYARPAHLPHAGKWEYYVLMYAGLEQEYSACQHSQDATCTNPRQAIAQPMTCSRQGLGTISEGADSPQKHVGDVKQAHIDGFQATTSNSIHAFVLLHDGCVHVRRHPL